MQENQVYHLQNQRHKGKIQYFLGPLKINSLEEYDPLPKPEEKEFWNDRWH